MREQAARVNRPTDSIATCGGFRAPARVIFRAGDDGVPFIVECRREDLVRVPLEDLKTTHTKACYATPATSRQSVAKAVRLPSRPRGCMHLETVTRLDVPHTARPIARCSDDLITLQREGQHPSETHGNRKHCYCPVAQLLADSTSLQRQRRACLWVEGNLRDLALVPY